jgi:uncharacterized membrane protein
MIALRWLLTSIHLLAAAGWFGAMMYSLAILHPKARQFFGEDDEKYESFISNAASGARWKVIAGLATIAVTGLALVPLARPRPANVMWDTIMIAKAPLLVVVGIIFWSISWRLWPKRVFATPAELPRIRRQFRNAGLTMIVIAAVAMVLSVWASVCRN